MVAETHNLTRTPEGATRVGVVMATSITAAPAAEAAAPHTEPDRRHVRPIPEEAWARLASRPGIFASDTDFDRLKAQVKTDEFSAGLFRIISAEADKALISESVEYVNRGSFLLGPMRTVEGRVLSLAMTWRLTGERKYLERARDELLGLCRLGNWGTNHFLDVGEAALTAGIGLNWLYEDLSAEDRGFIEDAIVRNALLPSLEVADAPGWPTADYNWNPVCHAGLAVGAIAVAERDASLSRRVIERAVRSLPYATASYGPDGTYAEGPSYWSYGTTFAVILVEALRTSVGSSFGLEAAPGFMGSVDFVAQLRGPSGEEFNYADYHKRSGPEPVLFWFARELGRGDVCVSDVARVAHLAKAADEGGPILMGEAGRLLPLGLSWWNPLLPPARAEKLPLQWVGGGAMPIGVMRSSWDDRNATFVAVKGGTPNGSHAHMDVGSFVLDADGVRWAIDLGTENYSLMREAKINLWNYGQQSTRWSVFRNGPEGHNILRFNGGRQVSDSMARLCALTENDGGGVRVDLTSTYASAAGVSLAERVVRLEADRSVTIIDRWTAGAVKADVTGQWLTRAEVRVSESGTEALLTESGKRLRLTVSGPAGTILAVQDVSAARSEADSSNEGVKRIVFRMPTTPAGESASVTLRVFPGGMER